MKRMKQCRNTFLIMLFSILCILPVHISNAATVQNGGANLSGAKYFSMSDTVKGVFLEDYVPAQCYKFVINNNSSIKIKVRTNSSDQKCYVRLKDSSAKQLEFLCTDDDDNWGYQSDEISIALSAGTYYLQVESATSEKTYYTINCSVLSSQSSSVKVAGQKNNYFGTAVNFSVGNSLDSIAQTVFNGMNWEDCHRYKFTLSSTKRVYFCGRKKNLTKDSLWIELYDKNGKKINVNNLCERDIFDKVTTDPWVWDVTATLKAGTYYIGISTPDEYIPYTIYTSFAPGKLSSVKASSGSKGKMKVSWKKSSCSGYEVQYCKNKSFKGSKVYKKSISKSNTVSYSKSGLSRRAYYYVRVRAYKTVAGRKAYGTWSDVRKVKIK